MTKTKMYEETVLGFVEEAAPDTNSPENLASKAGGLPIWLYRPPAKPPKVVKCDVCQQAQTFLLQIYCPLEEDIVGHGNAFHRMLYVMICKQTSCQRRGGIAVVRTQLARENEYYGWNGGCCVDGIGECCVVCGFWGELKCGGCGTRYCGTGCQRIDWRLGHKKYCGSGVCEDLDERRCENRFREVEIVTDSHPLVDNSDLEDEEEEEEVGGEGEGTGTGTEGLVGEMRNANSDECVGDVVESNVKGSMQDADEEELPEELFRGKQVDATFSRMQRIISYAPDQVIRYWRDGIALWGSPLNQCKKVPNCERCGGRRVFEMQIMSQLIYYICPQQGGESVRRIAERLRDDMEWITIAVYCCASSCGDGGEYCREFAWVH